ncbi:mitochondrial import inner membrane translocase subunit [Physcia stellaris]|nr:mitochondrial import inner membrane translocase subunit [Physcia stellaris]
MADHSRDPCPWVTLSDFGGAFAMGGIGGAVWHGVKGFRNSPYGERRIGAITAIKARAPVLGGNFGVWGGLFSTFDCAVKGILHGRRPRRPRRRQSSTEFGDRMCNTTGCDRGRGDRDTKDDGGEHEIRYATPPSCSSTSGTITVTDGSLELLSDGGVMFSGQLLYY